MSSRPTGAVERPKRVLILQKFSFLGGSQVSLVHHLALLDRARFSPFVVVSDSGWLTAKLEEQKIPWSRLDFGHWTNLLSAPRNLWLIFRLRKMIASEKIDLVYANEHWVGPLGYFAARLAGVPAICHFRTGLADLTSSRVRKYQYRRFDRVLVVADVLRRALAERATDPRKVVVVRDGVEMPKGERRCRTRGGRTVVMTVGALYPVKGQAKILEQALPWLEADKRRYLVFVGGTRMDESYAEDMKRLVREKKLERQVRFLGNREDVPRLLALADALVAYSTVEGIPRVVMEAMASGLPVIVSNTPGMDEVVVDGEVGRVVDFENGPNPLTRVLEDLSANPSTWLERGRKARARAQENYSTVAMSNAIERVYKELLD